MFYEAVGRVRLSARRSHKGSNGVPQDSAEAVAAALAVWWRPQTVDVLLPSVGEKSDPYRRRAAIKVRAGTRHPRAVYPIVRWIIREQQTVTEALKSMGPVAEAEVIKLLSDENENVRSRAAEILQVIGTKKSLPALRRAANDKRSGTAAGLARIALDAVQSRVAAPPATRPASE